MAATPTVISKTRKEVYIPPEYRTVSERYCYPEPTEPPEPTGPEPREPDVKISEGWRCTYIRITWDFILRIFIYRVCTHPTAPFGTITYVGSREITDNADLLNPPDDDP